MSKVQEKRKKLRSSLLKIAERKIADEGLKSLRARDLAEEAGCALGTIYTLFDDIEEIVLSVNFLSFKMLGQAVAEASERAGACGEGPLDRMIAMAHAYLEFATVHTMRWRALFDVNMTMDVQMPEWYLSELDRLLDHIRAPTREIWPELSETDQERMTRSLFSAIHGIVWLGLERRISGVPPSDLQKSISILLKNIAK